MVPYTVCIDKMWVGRGAWLAAGLALGVVNWASSVQYVPERTQVTYMNEKYATNASAFITKFGRKSPYYYNIHATIRHTWGNNITVHVLFFEYHNNQYKRSFVEFHLKLCDWILRDPAFGKAFAIILSRHGIKCPVAAGTYVLSNLTLPTENLPNVLTFDKGRSEVTIYQLPTHDVIVKLFINFHIRQST